ncbi:MAG TPA: methylenetetrahydromethanopterin dehydrogenase [Thiobacillaceae bacterium]|nr:methylenetetrahydromethanopterin dehydrogenase [Thiobacillaceae bacterium]
MEKPTILHFATPGSRVSPFDVNMAYDAGWDAVVPYGGVGLEDMAGFTQDAIFSRGPKGVKRTGIFIGGRDALLASDMLEMARKAMVPPFEVSVFADPSGAYTTAAAMVAKVEAVLARQHGLSLSGRRVVVFGGTGPVGMVAAALAAQAGAEVTIPGHDGPARAQEAVDVLNDRFGLALTAADASSETGKTGLVAEAEVILATAKAGVRVTIPGHDGPARAQEAVDVLNDRFGLALTAADASSETGKTGLVAEAEVILATAKAGVRVIQAAHLALASRLLVAADINAVPPSGIEGVGVMDDGVSLAAASGKAAGIGALAVGNLKYQVQRGLLQAMLAADKPRYLGFAESLEEARRHAA